MQSNSLNLEVDNVIKFNGSFPFLMGEDWLRYTNIDKHFEEAKELLINLFNSDSFQDAEVLIQSRYALYTAILAIDKGAKSVRIIEDNELDKIETAIILDKINYNIELIDNDVIDDEFDLVISDTKDFNTGNSSIIINLDSLEIIYPDDETRIEYESTQYPISLQDIFITLSERNSNYCILKNSEIISDSIDQFDDMQIDLIFDNSSKEFFLQNIGDYETFQLNNQEVISINIGEDDEQLILNFLIYENNLSNNIFDDDNEINKGIKQLNDKSKILYLYNYSKNVRGGLDLNYYNQITESLEKLYNNQYEWRANNFADISRFISLNTHFQLPLEATTNYYFDSNEVLHNYLINDNIFRVYYNGEFEIREVSPKLASKDIFILEKHDINTEIILENEEKIIYKIVSNEHQIILSPFIYLDKLLSDKWLELDVEKESSFIITKLTDLAIIGMHRSGTSMISGIIENLGIHLGTYILGSNDSNPTGHFEDQEFIELNDKILNSNGYSWDNVPDSLDQLIITDELEEEIKAFIKRKSINMFWGWKDPRTCITFYIFSKLLKNQKIIIIERDNNKVIHSLQKRNGFSFEIAESITNAYNNYVNEIKNNENFLLLNYNDFINEPEININKITSFLEIKCSDELIHSSKSFIKPRNSNKNAPISLLNEINDAILSNKFNDALDLINKIIGENNTINNIEYLKAFCLMQLGKHQLAYQAARNELIINPSNEKALELINKIKTLHPDIDTKIESPLEVTIAIPVFNNAIFTKACIESIYRETSNINYEILVVNNGSSDSTEEILKQFDNYNNFKVIHNLDNLGFAKAVNQAIRERSGKHLVLLNNDTIVTNKWLNSLLDSINSGIGIVGSCLLYPGTDFIQHIGVEIGTEDGKTIAPFHPNQYHSIIELTENKNRYLSAVTGAAMMINSKLLEAVPQFDENYINGLEDIDYCFQALENNYKIEYCSESIIYHFESMSEGRHDKDVLNWQRLNQKWHGKIKFDLTQNETINKVNLIKSKKELNSSIIETSLNNEINNLNDIKKDLTTNLIEPDFSIIIPVHNNLDYTKSCINNILKTSALYSIEIIIIENKSSDDTRNYLESYSDERIKVIYNTENVSFSKANNQGAKIAKSNTLIFLNNDVDVLPGWLESIENTFERDSSIGIQGAKLLYPNNTIQHSGIAWGPVSKDLNLHFHIYLAYGSELNHVNKSREFQMVTGALLAIRKSTFDEVKGFDEEYFFGHEDLDLCMKTREANYKVWYNHEIVATHHESITKKSEGIDKFERFIKNPNSNDAKNHKRFLDKWHNKLIVDSLNYYNEDQMYGLLGDIEKFNDFEVQLKLLFEKLKLVKNDYQTHANKVSELLFGRSNIDFVANSKLLLNASYNDLISAVTYLDKLNSKKKILFTMFGWNESGGGTILPKNMAKSLVRKGFDVTVFYAGLNHPTSMQPYFVEESEEDGVKLVGIYNREFGLENISNPELDIYNKPTFDAFTNLLDKLNPDIIHFQNFVGLSFELVQIAKSRNIYSIYIPYNYHLIDPKLYMINNNFHKWDSVDFFAHSEVLQKYPELKDKYIKRKEAAINLLNSVDHVQAVSSRVKDILVEFGGNSENIIVVNQVPNSTEKINDTNNSKTNNPIKFGFIGGIMPHKGVHNLVAASSALPPNSCEILLYGFITPGYKDLLDGIQTNVPIRFMGKYKADDLSEIAKTFDIAVLPSIWEDCGPHVISECLALNLPVIAPNIGGFSDYIKSDYNGYIYQYNDVEQLAKILFDLLSNHNKVIQLKNNANLKYTYEEYIDHVIKIYNEKPKGSDIFNYELKFLANVEKISKNKNIKTSLPMNRNINNVQGGFSNNQAVGIMPMPLPDNVKLNLGCGNDVRDGFINIDLFSDNPKVVFGDIRKLDLADEVADYILASDVLEHFSHRETDNILSEWNRVLKTDGTLDLRLPNIRLQIEAYQRGDWNADVASYMIFGGQTNPGDYHCIGFDEKTISAHLDKAGFIVESIENQDFPQDKGFINLNMIVKAKKRSSFLDEFNEVLNFDSKSEPEEITPENDSEKQLNIVWEGSQFVHHSLAKINREISYNLIKSGQAQITLVPFEPDKFSPDGDPKLELIKSHDVREIEDASPEVAKLPYVWVRHQWPPKDEAPLGSKWIIMQPWEYTSLRKEDVEIFKQSYEIWTPSNWSRNIFIDSGIDFNKVQVIPNGIDPSVYKPTGNKYHLKTNKRMKFLFVGGTLPRKGIDILLDTYLEAFNPNDDVCLVVKGIGSDTFYKGQNANEFIERTKDDPNTPEVEIIQEELTEEEMASLYRACSVLTIPYRAEGFCMPVLEAMACGLAVVVTDGGATDDFVNELVGWKIPSEYQKISNQSKLGETVKEAGWLVPNPEILKFILKDIYQNPSKLFALGLQGQFNARTHLTWRNSTLKILKRLDFIQGKNMALNAINKLPEFTDDLIKLGSAENEFNQGNISIAKEIFEEISRSNIDSKYKVYALNSLAIINLDSGNYDDAQNNIDNALNIKDNPDSNFLLTKLLFKNSEYEKALNTINPVTENWINLKWESLLGMTLDGIITLMAEICYEMEDFEAAFQLAQTALEVNSSNLESNLLMGLMLKLDDQIEQAETFFKIVLELEPENEDAKKELGIFN